MINECLDPDCRAHGELPCGGCGGQRVVYWPKAEGGAA